MVSDRPDTFATRTLYLAYHRSDGDLAHRVHDLAEELGYYVWRHIPAADRAPGEQLLRHSALRRAEGMYLVAIMSADFLASPWLLNDVYIARDLGLVVLLATVESLELPKELCDCRAIDLRGTRAAGLAMIHGFLAAELAPPRRLLSDHPLGRSTLRELRLFALDHWNRLDLDEMLLSRFIDIETFPGRPNERLVALLHDVHIVDLAAPLADKLVQVAPEAVRDAGKA